MEDEAEKYKKECHYLQIELKSLKEQFDDAKILIQLNKELVKLCFQPLTENAQTKLLKFVMEENQFLLKKLSCLSEERNLAYDNAFIVEQISDSNVHQENIIIRELTEAISDLKYQLHNQKEMQKQANGVIFMESYLASVDQTNLLFVHQSNLMNNMLLKYRLEIEELTEQKNELTQLNLCLSNEIIKLRTQKFNPRSQSPGFSSQNTNSNTFVNHLVQLQKKLFYTESIDERNELQQSGIITPLFTPQLPKKQNFESKHEVAAFIPQLNLAKAQQIQQYNVKRNKAQLSKIPTYDLESRFLEEQAELIKTCNRYHVQLILNQQLDLCLTEYQIKIKELEHINETLIASNKVYEEKWRKFYTQYEFYQKFYFSQTESVNQNSQKDQFEQANKQQFQQRREYRLYTQNKKYQPKNSILNYTKNDLITQYLPTDNIEQVNENIKHQQIILLNIAKEIYKIHIDNVQNPVQGQFRAKRSNSFKERK